MCSDSSPSGTSTAPRSSTRFTKLLSSLSIPVQPVVGNIVGCDCSCHDVQLSCTSLYLRDIVGLLRVRSGSRPLSSNCGCRCALQLQRKEMRFDYFFPAWLGSRIITLLWTSSPQREGAIALRIMRHFHSDTILFRALRSDHRVETVKNLFANGKGSPFDVDPHGNLPLHVRGSQAV